MYAFKNMELMQECCPHIRMVTAKIETVTKTLFSLVFRRHILNTIYNIESPNNLILPRRERE